MNLLASLVIHTANILGIFSDPFEFEGDYGPEVNPIRKQVFELVVSREALMKNLSDSEIKNLIGNDTANTQVINAYRKFLVIQAIQDEINYGPTLGEVATLELLNEIRAKQQEMGYSDADLELILHFLAKYNDKKIFHFLRNNPPALLNLDKTLRDKAAREGKPFDLPILGSTQILEGSTCEELKRNLLHAVFTKENHDLAKSPKSIKQALRKLDKNYLKEYFGGDADNQDLDAFCSHLGQVFFFWLSHSLNLDLVSANPEMIAQINQVKDVFIHTLGDPVSRAETLKSHLLDAGCGILFTQECDTIVPLKLMDEGLFHHVDSQNLKDGTLIILRSDVWEADYDVIPINDYDGAQSGRMNVILATKKDDGQRFLLASCHGNATNPEDGRLQISLVMEKFHQLNDGNLQVLIGIDANTKTDEDVELFMEHLDLLHLTCTQAGPTTIKKRMVTAQNSKSGRFAIDEEDYLITLKPEAGGRYTFSHVTVGFKEERANINQPLPNIHNPSDHYPVGAVLFPL
jgi:hypothetical protein